MDMALDIFRAMPRFDHLPYISILEKIYHL
jgi:hypothetical protein